jgi:DNA-binding response OmpR family regulator
MQNSKRIVICDDEAELSATVGEYLEKRGYKVLHAENGEALDRILGAGPVDAVILDIDMPGEDGLSILKRIRSRHRLGVLMLTAAGELVDRIVGLELGADDYLVKPVALRELEARLRAVLRRLSEATALSQTDTVRNGTALAPIAFAGFVLDREAAGLLGPDGTEVALTPLEFRLLRVLAEHPGRAMSRDRLLYLVDDREAEPFDRSIDNRVARLRRKIERNPGKPTLIRTVRGTGYLFDPSGG